MMHKLLTRVAAKVKDNWSLCESKWGKSEAEVLVAQTIHACANNLRAHGDAFSWLMPTAAGRYGNGLFDNGHCLSMLLRDGSFVEEPYEGPVSPPEGVARKDGKPRILRCSEALLRYCDGFVKK